MSVRIQRRMHILANSFCNQEVLMRIWIGMRISLFVDDTDANAYAHALLCNRTVWWYAYVSVYWFFLLVSLLLSFGQGACWCHTIVLMEKTNEFVCRN